MSFLSESAWSECEANNRLLQAAGVTDMEFRLNISGDYIEIAVQELGGYMETWFTDWREAHKYCMSKQPNANWDETGWNL